MILNREGESVYWISEIENEIRGRIWGSGLRIQVVGFRYLYTQGAGRCRAGGTVAAAKAPLQHTTAAGRRNATACNGRATRSAHAGGSVRRVAFLI